MNTCSSPIFDRECSVVEGEEDRARDGERKDRENRRREGESDAHIGGDNDGWRVSDGIIPYTRCGEVTSSFSIINKNNNNNDNKIQVWHIQKIQYIVVEVKKHKKSTIFINTD